MTAEEVFLASAIKRLLYYKELGEKTFEQLNEADFHFEPSTGSNSIAVIIQHMSGNMLSRWTDFLHSDGEKEWRNRDTEFDEQQMNKEALLAYWNKGWDCCIKALKCLGPDDLLKTIYIRSEGLIVIDAINRQLAHYPHHVGQILYAGKLIKGEQWKNLSIPKGNSDQFNLEMKTNQGK
jgi:hypothetical protein